jgi:EAL and modified HD-GYP domain-containing signal transduction protein
MLFAAGQDDYRAPMLLAHVTVRARRMELLAKAGGLDRSVQDQAFMAGMFSLLGILFGMPLAEVLEPLNLGATLSDAVLHGEGELGRLLHSVESLERADEAELSLNLDDMNLSPLDLNLISLEAHQWMLGVIHDKQDVADA